MKKGYLLIIVLGLIALGCDGNSPTSPSSPPAPSTTPIVQTKARLIVKRVEALVFVDSYFPPRIGIRFELELRETNGVGINLKKATLKIFNTKGGVYAKKSKTNNIRIGPYSTKYVNVTWVFPVQAKQTIGDLTTTYIFVDDNGFRKELTLTNSETRVVGLQETQQQFN